MYKQSMQQWLLTIAAVLFFCSCNQKQKEKSESGYVNHEKWEMYGDYFHGIVRGHPVEVKQIKYRDISDTTPDASGWPVSYQLSKFDKEGNRIYMILASDSAMSIESFYTYDENGMSYRIVSRNLFGGSRDSTIKYIRSTKEGPGKYKEVSTRGDSTEKNYTIFYYENDGNIVRWERWLDGKLRYTIQSEYSNGKLMSQSYYTPVSQDVVYEYHYSRKGFLDSVIAKSGNRAVGRKMFINNDHGDPVYYEKTENGKLFDRQTISYRYDDKSNWIRRIIYFDPSASDNDQTNNPTYNLHPYSDYKLEIREIKY